MSSGCRSAVISLFLLASLVGLSSCGGSSSGASASGSLPKVDGVIASNEYQNHFHSDQVSMDLYWTIYHDEIYFGLSSQAAGWVGFGLDPDGPAMKGADIVFGYIQSGAAKIDDEYAATLSSHETDVSLGGRDDLLERAGSESASGTTIEWSRKLVTGDPYDRSITAGKHLVMLAFSDSDDPNDYHGEAGRQRAEVYLDFFHPQS